MPRIWNKKKRYLLMLLALQMNSTNPKFFLPVCGNEIMKKVLNLKLGRGKGAPGFKRQRFDPLRPVFLFEQLKSRNSNISFQNFTRMYIDEFEYVLDELKYLRKPTQHLASSTSFENKVLLFFVWIVKYVDYSVLETLFGISNAVIGKLFEFLLPEIASYFLTHIPDEIVTDSTSSLSKKIIAIIDSTIHATQKPSKNQHLSYNDHYQRHGMMTTLLVNFDGYIASVSTNGCARLHDSMSAMFMSDFRDVLGEKNFALGDPGYGGVDYVVSGLKSNQLNSEESRQFDAISRHEQVLIEHVNKHIKNCKVLSKSNQFHHARHMHMNTVFVCCGWYNFMKKIFNKF
jgi:hypothetical protein